MIILGIETSCDETALSLIEATGELTAPAFRLIGSEIYSQIELHREYGGVFPNVAKRAHAENLIPLFKRLLEKTGLAKPKAADGAIDEEMLKELERLLEREPTLFKEISSYVGTIEAPAIDAIAVTYGPGLEPALWVGVNFAKALAALWNIPVIPTNHMEGHIISPLLSQTDIAPIAFPALAMLISGGHTELALVRSWEDIKVVGKTRDDAVGEAFDKAARMLGLPYPGGPEISRLADEAREKDYGSPLDLPRPMIATHDFDFSFSGLKTAVLYGVQKAGELSHQNRAAIAREFENAVTEVLVRKTERALIHFNIQTLIVAGGVIANKHIRAAFEQLSRDSGVPLLMPHKDLSTDNATMIAMAGYMKAKDLAAAPADIKDLKARGNLSFGHIDGAERP